MFSQELSREHLSFDLSAPASPSQIGGTPVVTLSWFWAKDLFLWSLLIKNNFLIHRISTETRRLKGITDARFQEAISEVRDILMTLRSITPYDDIKDAHLSHLIKSKEGRNQQLLNSEELGDRRTTQIPWCLQEFLVEKRAVYDVAALTEFFLKRLLNSAQVLAAWFIELSLWCGYYPSWSLDAITRQFRSLGIPPSYRWGMPL